MLKIKDDVDLNIFIEKYDFKPVYDTDTGKLTELYRINGRYFGEKEKRRKSTTITKEQNLKNTTTKDFWQILLPKRIFTNYNTEGWRMNLDNEDYEILFDLIQDGLVEKI